MAGRVHGDHVRVLQAGSELDLALEALGIESGRELRRQELDHHPPMERRLGRHEDAAHSPAPELALDDIAAPERSLEALDELGPTQGMLGTDQWGSGGGAGLQEPAGAEVGSQQRLDFLPERRVTAAGLIEEGRPLGGLTRQRLLEDGLDFLPALRGHAHSVPAQLSLSSRAAPA